MPKISAAPSPVWWAAAALTCVLLALTAAAISAAVVRAHPQTARGYAVPAAEAAAPTAAAKSAPAPAAVVAVTEGEAADWVVANVGRTHVVACDVTVCGLLRDRGFPPASLAPVTTGIADVERGDVAVITPLLRTQAGTALDAIDSEDPVAVFGTGASAIAVTPIALDGPAARAERSATDHADREAAGKALTANPRLTLTPDARVQLNAGMVDTRICALLALLTATHTVAVTSFTPPGPGAARDVPSAGIVIGTVDGQAASGFGAAADSLITSVREQKPPYDAMSVAADIGSGAGLQVRFAQPAVLGLLGGAS